MLHPGSPGEEEARVSPSLLPLLCAVPLAEEAQIHKAGGGGGGNLQTESNARAGNNRKDDLTNGETEAGEGK